MQMKWVFLYTGTTRVPLCGNGSDWLKFSAKLWLKIICVHMLLTHDFTGPFRRAFMCSHMISKGLFLELRELLNGLGSSQNESTDVVYKVNMNDFLASSDIFVLPSCDHIARGGGVFRVSTKCEDSWDICSKLSEDKLSCGCGSI